MLSKFTLQAACGAGGRLHQKGAGGRKAAKYVPLWCRVSTFGANKLWCRAPMVQSVQSTGSGGPLCIRHRPGRGLNGALAS